MTAQVPNTNTIHIPGGASLTHPIRVKFPTAGMKKIIARMVHRRQQRVLMEMPDYLLRDIGKNRYDIAQEVNTPFWR